MSNYKLSPSIDVWEAENTFFLQSPPSRLGKLIAHYELYKRILSVPGSIMELGVYKGASLVRFATFRNLLENDDSRGMYGLDMFGAFPKNSVSRAADQDFIKEFESEGGEGISSEDLAEVLRVKGFRNVQLVPGDVFETVPALLRSTPELKISLLHLDMDVYEPTAFAYQQLLPRMVSGGMVLVDDYGSVEGATVATDEICREHGFTLCKLPFYSAPTFFIVP